MAAPDKKPGVPADAAAASAMVEAVVIRGTVHTDSGPIGPGGTALVTADEVKRLAPLGFFRDDGDVIPQEVQDGKLRVSSSNGPTVSAA